jgi:hypothetical protein
MQVEVRPYMLLGDGGCWILVRTVEPHCFVVYAMLRRQDKRSILSIWIQIILRRRERRSRSRESSTRCCMTTLLRRLDRRSVSSHEDESRYNARRRSDIWVLCMSLDICCASATEIVGRKGGTVGSVWHDDRGTLVFKMGLQFMKIPIYWCEAF